MLKGSTALPHLQHKSSPRTRHRWRFGFAVALAAASAALTVDKEIYPMQTFDDPRHLHHYDIYLSKVAPRFDAHYTTHHLSGADSFGRTQEPLDPNVGTIEELIEELEAKVPNARVVLDGKDKEHPVLHLIDKKLGKSSSVLDQKITMGYSGVIGKLPDELHKIVPQIGPRTGGIASGVIVETDLITKVDIDVQQQSIRDTLTHSADLDTYAVWIWEAITRKQDDGTWKTEVWFGGAGDALKNQTQTGNP